MLRFRTEGFNGCAVKYSPFFDSRIAVAASANFGLVGNGRLYILDLTPNGIVPLKWYASISRLFHLPALPRGSPVVLRDKLDIAIPQTPHLKR